MPFLHCLVNRAGITAHNIATHMQLIGYNILNVSGQRALQLSSRQHYKAQTGLFYVAFWRFTTQPIKLKRFVKCVMLWWPILRSMHILTTYLVLFYANFQRVIFNGRSSKSKRITILPKRQSIQLLLTHCLFRHVIFLNKLFTHFTRRFQQSDVTAVPHAHTSDVWNFLNFNFSQLVMSGSLYLWIFIAIDKSNAI